MGQKLGEPLKKKKKKKHGLIDQKGLMKTQGLYIPDCAVWFLFASPPCKNFPKLLRFCLVVVRPVPMEKGEPLGAVATDMIHQLRGSIVVRLEQ